MRTLNRPMFRMGGPIKEGVMHGIREPYRSGQLVRPGPGRPGYGGPGDINPEKWLPKPNKIPKSRLGIVSTVGKKVPFFKKPIEAISRSTKDLLPRTWEKIKNVYKGKPNIYDPNKAGTYLPSTVVKTPPGIGTNRWWWEKGIVPTGQVAGAGIKKVVPYAGTAGVIGGGLTYGFWPDGTPKTNPELLNMNNIQSKQKGPPGGGDQNMGYVDPEAAKNLAAKKRDERITNLLETMGYDAAKKDAVSKALIDASQIVTERGTLDKKNITQELINPIIQATSKRLEKPEQLNEAVRLMLTKAEIEKEMNPLKDEESRLRIAVAKKTLAGGTLQEAVLDQTLKQGAPTGATLSQIARAKGVDNIVLNIKIPKNQDTLEVATETMEKWKNDPEKALKPGVYVVKDRIIVLDTDGSIKPYL